MARRTIEKTVEACEYTCDECGSTGNSRRDIPQCSGCYKDVCWDCLVIQYEDPWDGSDLGDYPMKLCKKCNEVATPFKAQAYEIREEMEQRLRDIEEQWIKQVRHRENS